MCGCHLNGLLFERKLSDEVPAAGIGVRSVGWQPHLLPEAGDEGWPARVAPESDIGSVGWCTKDQRRSSLLECLIKIAEGLIHSTEPRVHYRKVKWGDVARQSDFVDRSAHGIQDRTLRPSGA